LFVWWVIIVLTICLLGESSTHNLIVWWVECSQFGCLMSQITHNLFVWWIECSHFGFFWLIVSLWSFLIDCFPTFDSSLFEWYSPSLVFSIWFFSLIVSLYWIFCLIASFSLFGFFNLIAYFYWFLLIGCFSLCCLLLSWLLLPTDSSI
jgi:hypothetical protein